MSDLIIKDVLFDKSAEHIAHVIFFDKKQNNEFSARLDTILNWFIDPIRFEQDVYTNIEIAKLAH